MITMLFHPAVQLTAFFLSLYVLLLGVDRFRRLHLQQKTRFNWQRHVRLGSLTMILWVLGTLVGLIMVKTSWNGLLITGRHGDSIFIIVPLLLFGFGSGWYMHTNKQQRLVLPLLHGYANTLLIILVFVQALSGWQVFTAFVLGN